MSDYPYNRYFKGKKYNPNGSLKERKEAITRIYHLNKDLAYMTNGTAAYELCERLVDYYHDYCTREIERYERHDLYDELLALIKMIRREANAKQ